MNSFFSHKNGVKRVLCVCFLTGFILVGFLPACNVDNEKIAVLITGWGTPEGFSDSYWRHMAKRSRFGDRTEYKGQPCTEHHY